MNSVERHRCDILLATQVVHALGEIAERKGLHSLGEDARVVFLSLWAQGLVENGGFDYFYQGAANSEEVGEAYAKLGLHEVARTYYRSKEVFPQTVNIFDVDARRVFMERQGEETLEKQWSPLDQIVWKASTVLPKAIANFIRKRRHVFREVSPAVRCDELLAKFADRLSAAKKGDILGDWRGVVSVCWHWYAQVDSEGLDIVDRSYVDHVLCSKALGLIGAKDARSIFESAIRIVDASKGGHRPPRKRNVVLLDKLTLLTHRFLEVEDKFVDQLFRYVESNEAGRMA